MVKITMEEMMGMTTEDLKKDQMKGAAVAGTKEALNTSIDPRKTTTKVGWTVVKEVMMYCQTDIKHLQMDIEVITKGTTD